MWFEADPIFPYFPTIDPLVSDPGLNTSHSPDIWSTFSGPRANLARNDLAEPTWADDDSQFGLDLFSYATVIADERDEAFASKDGYRAMNEDGPIVVVGARIIRLDTYSWLTTGAGPDLFWTVHLDGGGGAFDFQPPDAEVIDVLINFVRPLTDSETEALEDFKAAIEALTIAINALADNAEVRLPNGSYVTGAALKALWAKTDFIINDGVTYLGGSTLGKADMVDGQPTITFNIQALNDYNNFAGGMNYLIAHDFAHLTQWGMPFYYDQLTANDIAREILSGSGLSYLINPEFGYSSALPFGFSTPGDGGDNDGGGTGGGGGGGGGDYIP